MKTFFKDFKGYDGCIPPGVRLPQIKIDHRHYKNLNISPSVSNASFLKKLCEQGMKLRKIHELPNHLEYKERLAMELAVLDELGFIDYILLNWDILNYCHENSIPTGPGRGSAAGSLVLYLIKVTNIDSLKYNLFFERFVSKSRAKSTTEDGVTYLDGSLLADIDNDIAYEQRHKVIEYINSKYPSQTAKILTLTRLSGKLCIKECGKIVGEYSEQEVNETSNLIPKKFGVVVPLAQAVEESSKFAEWTAENKQVYNIAQKLEGLNKNTGVHPSGIAISYNAINESCPLQLSNDGSLVTGYDMEWVAELMVKFDILGLRTLSVIADVCAQTGINITSIDPATPFIYETLQTLEQPQGLFQLEAHTNSKVCKKIRPRTLEELSAVVALARPGALDFLEDYARYREGGRATSPHPFYDEILESTAGIPLYQEQLMQMAVKVGFTLDEAEQIRRIVGKKKVAQMPAWKKKIETKIKQEKLPDEVGEVLWKVAEDSANYSFNKSHSIAYSTLAAWTTYLKFTYPTQFFLSLLKMTKYEPAPHEEIGKICQELSSFGITLLPPDLSQSKMDFSIQGKDIRFGLNSIKGVSEKSLSALSKFRESETPTKYNIFRAAKQAGLNIGVLSALIQAGALPEHQKSRARLVLEAQAFNILTEREKRNFESLGEEYNYDILETIQGVVSKELIADDGKPIMKESRFNTFKKKYELYKQIYIQNKKYEKFANWYFENKLLGHSPSSQLKDSFGKEAAHLLNSEEYRNMEAEEQGRFVGVVTDAFRGTSRNGNKYLKVILRDEVGEIPFIAMDKNVRRNGSWKRINTLSDYYNGGNATPKKDNIVVVYGTKGDDIIFAENFTLLDKKIYMKLSELKDS